MGAPVCLASHLYLVCHSWNPYHSILEPFRKKAPLFSIVWPPPDGFPASIMDPSFNLAQPRHLRSWQMNRSIACFFAGNDTSINSAAEYAAEARFGSVGIGWQIHAIESKKIGRADLEAFEVETARVLKNLRPDIRVLVTRNFECAGVFWRTVKTAVKEHPEWFLRTPDGNVYYVPWVAARSQVPGHASFWY